MMGGAQAVHNVSGKFVVQLCDEKHRAKVSRHVTDRHAAEDAPHFEALVRRHYGNLAKLPAFSISGASSGAVTELLASPEVCGVEAVRVWHALEDASFPVDETALWNLDRIDQTALPLDGVRSTGSYTGAGASVFILDTGVDMTHSEFANTGRTAINVASFVEDADWAYNEAWGWYDAPSGGASERLENDVDGHGTHCAGTCCGATVGVAPQADLYGIKVLDDDGSGSTDWIIDAIDAVAGLVRAGSLDGAVIVSMSLGGSCPYFDPIDCATLDSEALAIESLHALGSQYQRRWGRLSL